MKLKYLVFFLLILTEKSISQSGFPSYITTNTYLNNYTQPAPNAASLGKFVDYPVSYFTGVPEISVSLYNLKDGAAQLPISISYHASGIRVAEAASWVGLGWALNAGGMIARTVRGAPDEGSAKSWGGGAGPSGYYQSGGLTTLPKLPYVGSPDNFESLNTYPVPAITAGYMDTEPDLFTFNFNGVTGKFVFDAQGKVRLLTDASIQVTPFYSGGTFTSWIITTEDGTKYYFGENNMYEVNQSSSYLNSGLVDSRANLPADWYLTRIVYPNTKDTIYLSYTAEKYLYRDLPPESSTYNFDPGTYTPCTNVLPATDALQTTVLGLRLTNIQSKNYNIVFAAHNQRTDLKIFSPSPLPYSLDSVNVYTSQGQCLKRWVLNHGYFTSTISSTTARISTLLLNVLKDTTDTRRLKLVSLTEYSGDASISKPPYNFNYDETHQLPRRLSYDVDHWGFCNNSAGSANPLFTPAVSIPGCTANGPAANRSPKWPDMQGFTLTTMVDPLGVTTNFIFEAHATDIGGLRIKQITTTDSVTGMVNTRSFTYNGLMLYKKPQYLLIPYNEYYINQGLNDQIQGSYTYQGNNPLSTSVVVHNMIKQSQSITPLQDVQGNHIGYGSVRETFGSRGEGGYTVYTYQTYGSGNEDSRLDISNYTIFSTVRTLAGYSVSGLVGSGRFSEIPPDSLVYHSNYSGNTFYPIAPNQLMFGRGRLGNTATYDSTGFLLHQVSNTYTEKYHENYDIRGLKVFRTTSGNGLNNDALAFYKLHTGISHLTSTVVTDFKDGKKMTTTTNFAYESPYHTLKTGETTTNSTGDTIVKKTYYSFDYTNGAFGDSTISKMKARNMLVPIATRVWKNNTLISGTVTQYKDFASSSADTFINPLKLYSMETTVPLTIAQAGENIALTGQLTTLVPDANFIEKADFNFNGTTGKITEQKLVYDKNQSIIWDNQLSLPLAQTDNAYFTDVAYTSFESAETGNWSFSNTSIISDATAPTGAKGFTLSGGNPITKASLTSAKSYVVSYWLKSGASITITGGSQSGSVTGRTLNGWTYHEVRVTGTSSLSITGSGSLDELRLYPSDAQMNTYTYDSMMRLIATCSVNSTISYYEYDSFNRVTDIKDQFGNIIKAFEYNYGRLSR